MVNDIYLQRKQIDEVLASLTSLERSEFARRLRSVLNSKALKINLVKQHNALQEAYQQERKIRTRNEIVFLVSALLSVVLISFFGIDNSRGEQTVGILIFAMVATCYLLKKDVADSFYLIKYRNYQFEIDRLTNEIHQYGYFLVRDADLFLEYCGDSEELKKKFVEVTSKARIELELEILENMYLDAKNCAITPNNNT